MRMKEDHMQNGQLRAGYNLQVSTNQQFITHYSIHQNPTDTTTFIPHFEEFKKLYKSLPKAITADAGYGSQQNYEYLEQQQVEAYVKYPYFHKEQKEKKKHQDNLKDTRGLHYNAEKDCYYCPMGQAMKNIGKSKRTTANGYEQQYTKYQAKNCQGCPLRGACHKGKGNRIIEVNKELNRLKEKAREKLLSEKGIAHRKQRPWDVEAVFGNIKQNKGFKRFALRGLRKVEIEIGLIAMAHNLAKLAA